MIRTPSALLPRILQPRDPDAPYHATADGRVSLCGLRLTPRAWTEIQASRAAAAMLCPRCRSLRVGYVPHPRAREYVDRACPKCGGPMMREASGHARCPACRSRQNRAAYQARRMASV